MKWELPPKREAKVAELIGKISEILDSDIDEMSKATSQRQAQCLASMLRPLINMERPNTGTTALADRRQKPWRVQCRFGFDDGSYSLADDGEFEWETVYGFDAVIEVVRACFDDYHWETGSWGDAPEFNNKAMKQRFGGMYSNISKGGGEASTRIVYAEPPSIGMFLDVTIERAEEEDAQKKLDLEETNEDSSKPAINRLREMREARGKS
jgi:hypothetical protein